MSTQNGDITTTYVHGVKDIRLGIDIQGGVDVTFEPAGDVDATDEQMDAALEKIKTRLVSQGINDSDTYVDYKSDRIIVRFPWQAGETDFDPEQAVKELGETAQLTFRYGTETTTNEDGETVPAGEVVLTGDDVKSAGTGATQDDTTKEATWMVTLDLNDSGTEKFYNATSALYQDNGKISIWMDNTMISAPSVNAVISDGKATISGTLHMNLQRNWQIRSMPVHCRLHWKPPALRPFPDDGRRGFECNGDCRFDYLCLYCDLHDFLYRLLGVVASICLMGQIAGMLAAVSSWFGFMDSNTLTIPGIAGIILSIGMGVDANIITGERIREELRRGKPLDGALQSGYSRAFSAIFDGNLTGIIVSIILMGAFGTPDSWCAKLLHPLFQFFGATTEGVIYSFGYTLLVGLIMNFIMGVFAARLMTMSLSKFKCFQNKKLYGGGLNG